MGRSAGQLRQGHRTQAELCPGLLQPWQGATDLKRLDEAIASYDRAIALKPDYAQAWCNRGNLLNDLENFQQALASYDKAIALKPDYAEAWSNRGTALQYLYRLEEPWPATTRRWL